MNQRLKQGKGGIFTEQQSRLGIRHVRAPGSLKARDVAMGIEAGEPLEKTGLTRTKSITRLFKQKKAAKDKAKK